MVVIRVLIADDHSVVREGLRMFLQRDPDLEVVGEAADGAEAIQQARLLRPDVVVKLPNKRVIAVDAKVPLSEYSLAANETDETRKRDLLGLHARALRRHIETLSRREYQAAIGDSLDFTVMFLPGEHFLSAALIADPTLFEFAATRRIFVASPTVLIPLLRAVAEADAMAEAFVRHR